jgi:outer membrane protein assembly factor BamD
MSRTWRAPVLGAALALPILSCAHGGIDVASLSSSNDEVVWAAGVKALEKKNWENARQHFKRIVEGFPQSEHAPEARLNLAEAYFEEGGTANLILAIAQYRDFLTLFPSHPRADYAQFRTAEAYFKQKNSPDRDQDPTIKALAEYQRLLDVYPQSNLIEKARGRIHECREILARAEFLAGYFYQRTRQAWRAATLRYQVILKDYPDYSRTDEVLFRMAECYAAAGRMGEALPLLDRLLREYPQSEFAVDARKLNDELAQRPKAPETVAAPSPQGAP